MDVVNPQEFSMSNFMSPEFQDQLSIRIDGRAYPVTFTGANNRTTAVEGHNMPEGGGDRKPQSNHGNRAVADFATPVQELIVRCNALYHEHGMAGLHRLQQAVAEHREDSAALKAAIATTDAALPALVDQYEAAWKTMMGNAESPVIFREDVADIVRTFAEVEAKKANEPPVSLSH